MQLHYTAEILVTCKKNTTAVFLDLSKAFDTINALLFQILKYSEISSPPWGSVSYRPSASPSYEASSHVKNYAYSGKLLLLIITPY